MFTDTSINRDANSFVSVAFSQCTAVPHGNHMTSREFENVCRVNSVISKFFNLNLSRESNPNSWINELNPNLKVLFHFGKRVDINFPKKKKL